ncbi:hypothetical protein KUL42_38230 [Alteromonas sp. KUL42]|uniref:hypothetical protein n=1 Tax=Alteromonas sp. KUL42 TaxID=2480797 RepID=UPI0010FFC5E9|nr:hypothetical protein [Alteromonas sp. KUL42]GEA09062.1 hypothetical protein KUL42_38230 [Alteromonas sp. KUL42]
MLSFTEEANSEHGPNHLSVFMGSTEFSGPGYEYTSEHEFFVTRLGALYEFRYKGYTLSPQFHFDYHEGLGSSKVVGLAVVFDF